jgi:biopolymer transport protein ExbD
VAFQLIMFFLVTASSVFFKSMEIPPPDPEKQQAAQQASARTIEDLQNDNILVEIDERGQVLVDHAPVEASRLAEALRSAREATGRLSMLLMADLRTPHRNAVLAYDAASEIGLTIKIGRPSADSGE